MNNKKKFLLGLADLMDECGVVCLDFYSDDVDVCYDLAYHFEDETEVTVGLVVGVKQEQLREKAEELD